MNAVDELTEFRSRLQTLEVEVSHLREDRDRLTETVLGLMETLHPFPDLSPQEYERLRTAGASNTLHDLLATAERELAGLSP